jgi:hypothetical protein
VRSSLRPQPDKMLTMCPEWTLLKMARPTGFEPVTPAFGGQFQTFLKALPYNASAT